MTVIASSKSFLISSVSCLVTIGFLSTAWLPLALGQGEPGWQQKWEKVKKVLLLLMLQ